MGTAFSKLCKCGGSRSQQQREAEESPIAEPSATPSPKDRSFLIIHFNDTYHIDPRPEEPIGGAARFSSVVKRYSDENPLIVFSGDALSPSSMSTATKGKQMVAVLNELGIHCACIGNHEYDFGIETLEKFVANTNFPWLLMNVVDERTQKPIGAGVKESVLMDWQGVKIGLFGVADEETYNCVKTIYKTARYIDFVEAGRKAATELREQGAELVICVSHMRVPNDKKICEQLGGAIDILLGGHDHFYHAEVAKSGVQIVKSGSDFKELSTVRVTLPPAGQTGRPTFAVERLEVNSKVEEDPKMKQIVDEYMATVGAKLGKVIFSTDVALPLFQAKMRSEETLAGNMFADIMREETGADITAFTAGTCKIEMSYGPGPVKLGDIHEIFPYESSVIVKKLTGAQIVQMLEIGLSKLPHASGRFLQVSGISFTFDGTKEIGQRVLSVEYQGQPIDSTRVFNVAMSDYMSKGGDGYDFIKGCEYVVDEECAQDTKVMIVNHFRKLKLAALITGAQHQQQNEGGLVASSSENQADVLSLSDVQLSEPEQDDFKKSFELFDLNKSGTISLNEMDRVFEAIGVPYKPAFVKRLLNLIDLNKDGEISFDELMLLVKSQKSRANIVPTVSPKIEGRIVCVAQAASH